MTEEEIMNLEAGEELDNLVAVKVMGWHKGIYTSNLDGHIYTSDRESWLDTDGHFMYGIGRYPEYDDENFHTIDWHPSQSILWAWEVMRKIQKRHYIHINTTNSPDEFDVVAFFKYNSSHSKAFVFVPAELGICRAALWLMDEEGK